MEGGLGAQEILPIHQDIEQLLEEIGKYVNKAKESGEMIGIAMSAPGAVNVSTGVIVEYPATAADFDKFITQFIC